MRNAEYWTDHFFKRGLLQSTKEKPVYSWQAEQMFREVQTDAIRCAWENKIPQDPPVQVFREVVLPWSDKI